MKTGEKIILVTGANAGIGFATACGLARLGAAVVLVCRDPDRGNAALTALGKVAVASPSLFIADFALQSAVRDLSRRLHERLPRIDVLINNAGAAFARRELTVDGIEKTFAINHLAPFLLTNLVLDLIRRSSAGRIVNVTAGIPVSRSSFLENLQGEKHYSQFSAYRSSKIANILFTYELARRLQGTGITVNCVHPGPVRTEFTRKAGGMLSFLSKVLRPIMKSPEAGARTPIYLATAPEPANVTGGYFVNCRQKKSAPITYDRAIAEKLWRISMELTLLDSGAESQRKSRHKDSNLYPSAAQRSPGRDSPLPEVPGSPADRQ